MKILHTSDWHIGKKLNGKSRLDEQKAVLGEISSICEREEVDLVLVAGDVYDTYTPSAEAEELFFQTLNTLASQNRAVVIIGGNHDDCRRLCASSVLTSKSNVYVFGGENVPAPCENLSAGICASRTGSRYCVIRKGDEKLFVGVLPYPTEKRLGEKNSEESFDEKIGRWIAECFTDNAEGLPQILVSHLFMLGGVGTDCERKIELGGTRAVDKRLIAEDCIYTALGHLHKRQVISNERKIYYSGAILEYGFDEAGVEKSVNVFSVADGAVCDFKTIALTQGKKLARLAANTAEDGAKLAAANLDCWVELTLHLDEPLSESQTRMLAVYANIAELKIIKNGSQADESRADRRKMDDRTAFIEYYKGRYGCEPDAELLNAFLTIMQEDAAE